MNGRESLPVGDGIDDNSAHRIQYKQEKRGKDEHSMTAAISI